MRLLLMALAAFFLFSCTQSPAPAPGTIATYFNYGDSVEAGGVKLIPVKTPVGNFQVWTKRFGSNPKIKILLLHGGPAMTHEYLECFETFFQRQGYEFYEYDQLGSYYSDQPKDSTCSTSSTKRGIVHRLLSLG